MPSLILSSRYSLDSQILRQTAQNLGWETLRLDGWRIPDWFDPNDEQIAFFHTAPHAFDLAEQLSRTLLGCHPNWTVQLPKKFLQRELRQISLAEASELSGESFIKHSVSKAFPAGIYTKKTLAEATAEIPRTALIHVGEPVKWLVEYRCFVMRRTVVSISPYLRFGEVYRDNSNQLDAPDSEIREARQFAELVIQSGVNCPRAFVLDVGLIEERGWAVVEVNECWASGIYYCNPQQVLQALLCACVPTNNLTGEDRQWDFQTHYSAACS